MVKSIVFTGSSSFNLKVSKTTNFMLYFSSVLRALKCRLYPNAAQAQALTDQIDRARQIYNQALEQRIYACKANGKGFTFYDQAKQLTLQRTVDARMRTIPAWVQRDGLIRLDSAFKHFFRRCKNGAKKKGFPRFKSSGRWNSVTHYEVPDPAAMIQGRIRLSGIKKTIRCRGLQLVVGTPKRVTIVHRGGRWYGRVLIDDRRILKSKQSVTTRIGLDMGLSSFLTTSEGTKVACPKHYRKLEPKLRRAQRLVSRRVQGSKRRARALFVLQRIHEKIADCRSDFTHKLSKQLVSDFDLIVAEKLNIKGMVRGRFGKSILDAGWGQFLFRLSYKAESAGKTFVQIDPRGTSQECSRCGEIVRKELFERTHRCGCGCVLDRDHNAALNVLKRVSTPGEVIVGHARGESTTTSVSGQRQAGSKSRVGRIRP